MKYTDKNALTRFWEKIKQYIDSKIGSKEEILFEGEATEGTLFYRNDATQKRLSQYKEIHIFVRENSSDAYIDNVYIIKVTDNFRYTTSIQLTQIHSNGFFDFITIQIDTESMIIANNYRTKYNTSYNGFVNYSDNPNKIVKVVGVI